MINLQTLICPITLEIMQDPVMDKHGHSFERTGITEWLRGHRQCPLGGEDLTTEDLFSNVVLKNITAEATKFREEQEAREADEAKNEADASTRLKNQLMDIRNMHQFILRLSPDDLKKGFSVMMKESNTTLEDCKNQVNQWRNDPEVDPMVLFKLDQTIVGLEQDEKINDLQRKEQRDIARLQRVNGQLRKKLIETSDTLYSIIGAVKAAGIMASGVGLGAGVAGLGVLTGIFVDPSNSIGWGAIVGMYAGFGGLLVDDGRHYKKPTRSILDWTAMFLGTVKRPKNKESKPQIASQPENVASQSENKGSKPQVASQSENKASKPQAQMAAQ